MLDREIIIFFGNMYLRMFFLLAPFFGMSMFVNMSEDLSVSEKKSAAVRTSIAVLVLIFIFFFFGKPVFYALGITLSAFQIGAGSVLFTSSLLLILGLSKRSQYTSDPDDDFSVTPLAVPIVVGPGTIGTLLVWGNEIVLLDERLAACLAFIASSVTVFLFLFYSDRIQRLLGPKIISILIKTTALILTALAAQIVFTGIRNFA